MAYSDLNRAKIVLANEVTTLAHGQAQAKQAEETALSTFKAAGLGQSLPTFKLEQTHVEQGAGLLSIIVALGFAPSNSAARRLVESGAVKLDQETIHDPKKQILIGDFTGTNPIKLSIGKKKIGVIQSSYVK